MAAETSGLASKVVPASPASQTPAVHAADEDSAADGDTATHAIEPDVPAAGESPARPAAFLPRVLAEAPTAKWFVRPESGGQFGPADSSTLVQWLSEHRISRDSFLWREGWEEWQVASAALDDFFEQNAEIPDPNPLKSIENESELQASTPKLTHVELARDRRRRKKRRNHVLLLSGLSVLAITLVIALAVVLWLQQST